MAPIDPARLAPVLQVVVDNLQVALVLAGRLEPDVRQSARDMAALYAALDRAAVALQRLQPGERR